MALAIATNNAALNAAASASSVNRDMETSMARLSSGKRINSASDDAAGVAISSRLSAEIRGTDQAIRNALDGQALIDTAEGAHSEIENILQRMREVSVQAANGTNNAQDRANLQAEMNALVNEIDRIAGTTTWAGEKLMEAEEGSPFSFQVGAKTDAKNQIDITINGMGAHSLGLKADPADVAATLKDVGIGQSSNTVTYDPAFDIRQGAISALGVVTANNGNTSITLPGLGLETASSSSGSSSGSGSAAPGAPVASISGGTLTVDPGAVGLSGDVVVAFDVGAPITIPLDGTEADVAAIATKIETAINNGVSSGGSALGAPVASISGGTLTVDPGAVGRSGDVVVAFDVGAPITIPLDGTEAHTVAIGIKIANAINSGVSSGGSALSIASANKDGTVDIDLTGDLSGTAYDGASTSSIDDPTTTARLAGSGAVSGSASVASANGDGTVDIDLTGDLSATSYNGASTTRIDDPATTARLAGSGSANGSAGGSSALADVSYDATVPSSINAAVDAINAATHHTNISATVGADGSDYPGQIILRHNADGDILPDGSSHTEATGLGVHLNLDTVYTAYDKANSDPAATIEVIGQEGVISFHENAGTAFKLVLALNNSTGAPGTNSSFAIDTTADLQLAVDAINGTAGAGTAEHGYTASIVATPDGSSVNGTIKLTSGSAGLGFTQVLLGNSSNSGSPSSETITTPQKIGSEFKINTSNTNNTSDIWTAPVTVLADGSFVVTWEAVEAAGSYNSGIFAQIYDASGSASGSEFQISTFAVGGQPIYMSSPSSAALPDGGFVVTWTSSDQDGDGLGVRGQRFDASGATVGSEFQVNTATNNQQESSSVTALSDGGFAVTWESYLTGGYEQIGSGLGIFGQRYDAAGDAVGVEFQINTTADQWQELSNVEALAHGGFVVTWSTLGDDGTSYNIFGQRYDAGAAAVGAEFQVNATANDEQWVSTTTGLTDGGFVVTWTSNTQDGDGYGIYGQRYDAAGVAAGGEFQINTHTSGDQQFTDVTALPDGGFVVTWTSNGQDGDSDGVYGQRFDAVGGAVGAEFQINTFTNGQQQTPSVAAMPDGRLVVTWSSDGQDTSEHGVYGQIFDVSTSSSFGSSSSSSSSSTSVFSLDLGAVGHASQTMTSSDGSFDTTTGMFTPSNVSTTGTVSLTLADETLTIDGISNKGASPESDAAAIAAAINASSQGYKAEVMKGADTGKVKITQPAAPAKDMDVTDDDKARETIVAIDAAIQTVNIQRSKLGAVSNRLSHTINNLTNISSNLSAAQGGIEDADFAMETTNLAKDQILQQASTAMLAQANASKQNVLSLLQG